MIEIELINNNFLQVRESLTRMGIANQRDKVLYQSCHILKKFNPEKAKNCYYIVHFKELMQLDGKHVELTEEDQMRTYSIARALESWGLVQLTHGYAYNIPAINNFRVIKASQKVDWTLKPKYIIGGNNESNNYHQRY